jgi:hypothetical protein
VLTSYSPASLFPSYGTNGGSRIWFELETTRAYPMLAQVLIDAEVCARSDLNDLSAAKSLPYFHPWRVRQGWTSCARAGRMRDEITGWARKGRLTCGPGWTMCEPAAAPRSGSGAIGRIGLIRFLRGIADALAPMRLSRLALKRGVTSPSPTRLGNRAAHGNAQLDNGEGVPGSVTHI